MRKKSFVGPILAYMLCSLTTVIGCGPGGAPKTEIFGKVTFNGTAIEEGDIAFHPEQGTGLASSGPISKGEYKLTGPSGLMPGTYGVRVNAYRKGKPIDSNLDLPPDPNPKEQFLPQKFNTKSTIEKLVVGEGSSKVEKNFDLK